MQITSPFAPTAFMNGVLRCELSESEIDHHIKNTVETFSFKRIAIWMENRSVDSSSEFREASGKERDVS